MLVQLRVVDARDVLDERLRHYDDHDYHGDFPSGSGRRMHSVPGSSGVQESGWRGGRVRGQDYRVRGALSGRRVWHALPPGVRDLCRGHVRHNHHTGERVPDASAVPPVPKHRYHHILLANVRAEREHVRHRVAVRHLLFRTVPHVLPDQRRNVGDQVRDDRHQPVSAGVDDRPSFRRHRRTRPSAARCQRRAAQAQTPVHQRRCQGSQRAVQLPAGSIPDRLVHHGTV